MSDGNDHPFADIERTFKRAVAALREAGIPFLVGGTLASWARGGPEPRKDLDIMVRPEDSQRALAALAGMGMRPERAEEEWLLKARDGEVIVDVIHQPKGMRVDEAMIDRAEEMELLAMSVRVMALEDVMVSKLLALSDHELDLESTLQIARSVREQIDWDDVDARTAESPYARAFLTLVDELGVAQRASRNGGRARVRILN